MSTTSKDYKRNYTGSGMENLRQLLLALVQEKHHSVGSLQLDYAIKESRLVSWNLNQVIGEPPSDSCRSLHNNPYI